MQNLAQSEPVASNVNNQQPDLPVLNSETKQHRQVRLAATAASKKIAPLWPLKSFVAVNPFLGLAHQDLGQAGLSMAQASGARLTMPRAYYAKHLGQNRITDADLDQAIKELAGQIPLGTTPAQVRAQALRSSTPHGQFQFATFAEMAAKPTGVEWQAFIENQISTWASAFFDEGIAGWATSANTKPNDSQHNLLNAAWTSFKRYASVDRSAELLGLQGARKLFAALPSDPFTLLTRLADDLNLQSNVLDTYFHSLLCDVSGWAGYARFKDWSRELGGADHSGAEALLAIRGAWEFVILKGLNNAQLERDWLTGLSHFSEDNQNQWYNARGVDLVMQLAFERSEQRQLFDKLAENQETDAAKRPSVQAAFCIDVRSERFRRALEVADPDCETIGFAGFFGLAVGYQDNAGTTTARCPVLLEPAVQATAKQPPATAPFGLSNSVQRVLAANWSRFQRSAISNFGFVEALGATYLPKLLKSTFVKEPADSEHDHSCVPDLPLDLAAQADLAEGLLRGMSLVNNFAPIVLLAGHGSTTANNPYASALDCGACGGHAGDINARLAAQILNQHDVREELTTRGIQIPSDTLFAAGLHDTTTDDLSLFELDAVPGTHKDAVTKLTEALSVAAQQVRIERAPTLSENTHDIQQQVSRRASDWSQVRPEWGLAGCNTFIAAPRSRTKNVSLDGRCFLHNYNAETDPEHAVLEAILTAPLVVASWIALQYYGSTVDNKHFGSGDKTLHNVVGGIGVLEGAAGDLRGGLPMQSLHDGQQFVHEPMRLTALIEAPVDAIEQIIAAHPQVKDLVDNNWIQLHAIQPDGTILRRHLETEAKTGTRVSVWAPIANPAN